MSRPLRIEFNGALYHVTSRGDRKERIYDDNVDRTRFLEILGDTVEQQNWICHAYCLMGNHYHLVIETPDGNLSKGMRQLNGVFTQASNRRHRRVGHLFQGRYKAILIDTNSYLLEVTRYVVLNPVRAEMVECPGDWPWSSYLAMFDITRCPKWLTTQQLLAHFSGSNQKTLERYEKFVTRGVGESSIWVNLNRQIYLGDDQFVERALNSGESFSENIGVPKIQRCLPPPTLISLASEYPTRNEAISAAYATGEYSYQQIGEYFGLHFASVGRIVRGGS